MSKVLSPAKREAAQRLNILRKLERIKKNYNCASVTDAVLQSALDQAIAFIRGAAKRNNRKTGSLGIK